MDQRPHTLEELLHLSITYAEGRLVQRGDGTAAYFIHGQGHLLWIISHLFEMRQALCMSRSKYHAITLIQEP